MNGTKDPAKRKEKLQERIKHLEEQRAVVDDQIDIMKGEIRAIEVNEYITSLESRALDVMK
jgi:chaperonin cofactor prefoldin